MQTPVFSTLRRARLARGERRIGTRRSLVLLAALLALGLAFGVTRSAATGGADSYSTVVFSESFEAGNLSSWNGLLGNGAANVDAAGAHAGAYGLRLTNAAGQFQVAVKALPAALPDSSVTFWVRVASGPGYQTVAQARDDSSSAHMWDLAYDGTQHGFYFYPYSSSGAVELFTGANSAPADTWLKVEIQYTAAANGGARLFVNGQSQAGWGVSGDYTRSANLQRLQLWNDGANETSFDDLTIATPAAPATVPSAPTGLAAVAGDGSAALSWVAPASNGGSALSGYRITPFVNGVAQTPISTGSTAPSYTVTGLSNGTTYTFTVAAVNSVGASVDSAASNAVTPRPGYTQTIFSDGFESGTLGAWASPLGNGSATVAAAGARTGSYGLTLSNASGQFQAVPVGLSTPLVDSSTSFWVRIASGTGYQMVAQARDAGSGLHMWDLAYDGTQHAFFLYPYASTGATEISTGANSAPAGTWLNVEIQYTATAAGGARIFVDGTTQPGWGVTGDYSRSASLQRLQLWNDGPNAASFDDVRVAGPANIVTPPGAPTGVTGTAGDTSASLTWTAPASNGGGAITAYRVTPYVGATAQTPVTTSSAATSYTVTGLTNGTSYTFTVAAINAAGTGADSAPSAPITPLAAPTVPGAPTAVGAVAGDRNATVTWTAPISNGGSAITTYVITPYIGTTAQAAITTGSAATSYQVGSLTNGTAYTFTVAARNAIGTGAASAASAAVTPRAGYTNVVFADGFETGDLSQWSGAPGNGTISVVAGAARTGAFGLRMTNAAAGNYSIEVKALAASAVASQTSFYVRMGSGSGLETIAQARDSSSGTVMWEIYYDWNRNGFLFFPYSSTGGTEIFTGTGSVTPGTWVKLAAQYDASTSGGARLYLNDTTQPAWGVTGNFARTAVLQRIQLWSDAVGTNEFDDVRVTTPPPAGSTVAGAPTGVTAAPRDGAAALHWSAPSSDGGSAISGYRITPRINGVAQTPIVTDYPVVDYTVTGLTNGTAYTFTVAAVNGVGTSAESTATSAVTPSGAALPGVPTNVTGVAKDGGVALAWTAPTSDGGAAISSYVITPYIGATAQPQVTVGATTSALVSGLTNGTAYSFTVAARNAVGTGAPSVSSATITPAPALSEYTNVVLADGFETGTLAQWTAPQGTGSASVGSTPARTGAYGLRLTALESQYVYTTSAISAPVADSVVTFWVRPGNGAGVSTLTQARDGSSSQHMWDLMYDGTRHGLYFYPYTATGSTELFTGMNTLPAGVWSKLQIQYTAATAGTAQLYINGQTQAGWGLSGNFTRTANLQRLQFWNEGLRNDTTSNDFDDVSIATLPPVGASPPDAPTGVTGAPLDHGVALSWTAPDVNGGSPVTRYQITAYLGASRTAQAPILTGSAATSFTVAGLTNGETYTFTVAAVNAAGTGPDSDLSAPVTPVAAPPPGAPTSVDAVAGDGSATLDWTAPTSDGGSAITNYRITPSVNGVAQPSITTGSTATSYTVTGLTNGTAYTFTVAAANVSGFGSESDPSSPVTPAPPTVPGAPSSVTGSPRDSAVALTWAAPASTGGSPITSYRITPYRAGVAQTAVVTTSSATGFTVTGLTNGTAYTFTVEATNAIGTGAASAPSAAIVPAIPPANPIVLENQKAGTTSWLFDTDRKAENHEIEGYASATSVNKGSSIDLMVSLSSNASYTMDVYRMGWYPTGTNPDGTSCSPSCGGRLMQHIGPLSGSRQASCPTVTVQNDPNFGMVECQWTPSYTLDVPATWTTGNYIVKLIRSDGAQLENYLTFVVRDDASTAPVVYSEDVSTWQAYNFWGGSGNQNVGYDLYGKTNDVTFADLGPSRAYTVSFDRPYLDAGASDGAGLFMVWDFPMIRWMESKGYDMTYVTSVDLENNTSLLSGHRVFVNTGHDEYYSDNMRSAIQNGISGGVNMAFFSANNFYFRVQWQPNGSGTANRRIHCDKNALAGSTTFQWRLLSPARPENEIGGVMLNGVASDRNFLVADASSWIYAGTGLKTYVGSGTNNVVLSGTGQNAIRGLIGYEIDARAGSSSDLTPYVANEPAGVKTVGHSFVPASDNGVNSWSDAVLWSHPSGATVFSAGTIQWAFGVDNGINDGFCDCGHTYANPLSQRITQNILDRFSGQ